MDSSTAATAQEATRVQVTAWIATALNFNDGKGAFEQLVAMVRDLLPAVPKVLDAPIDAPSLQRQEQLTFLVRCITSLSSQLHELHHEALLKALYSVNLWLAPEALRTALLDLVAHLVLVKAAFLQPCIDHIVRAFLPPPAVMQQLPLPPPKAPWSPPALVQAVHQGVCAACSHMLTKVPRSAPLVCKTIAERLPHKVQSRDHHCVFLHAVLALAEAEAGAGVRDTLLAHVVSLLVTIDVDIRWEGIVDQLTGQEEEEGSSDEEEDDIFGMEDNVRALRLSGADAACAKDVAHGKTAPDGWEGIARSPPASSSLPQNRLGDGAEKSLEMADKLDAMMDLVFRHMRARADAGQGPRLWDTVRAAFQESILLTHRAKFTPYVVYHATTLLRSGAGAKDFVELLVSRILDPAQPAVVRTTCAAYCASFLARSACVPSSVLLMALNALADFAQRYSDALSTRGAWRGGGAGPPPLRAHNSCGRSLVDGGRPSLPGKLSLNSRVSSDFRLDGLETRSASDASTSGQRDPGEPPEGWQKNEVYYAAVQAIIYVVCYHAASIPKAPPGEASTLRALITCKVLPLLQSDLKPLHVCLPTAVSEFSKQLAQHRLGSVAHLAPPPPPAAAPSDSAAVRARRPLEIFFPFDPYLLPISAPHLELDRTYRVWRHGHVVTHAADARQRREEPRAGADARESDDDDDADRSDSDSDSDDSTGDSPRACGSASPLGTSPQTAAAVGAAFPAFRGARGVAVPAPAPASVDVHQFSMSDGFSGHAMSPDLGMSPGMSPVGGFHASLTGASPDAGCGVPMSCTPDVSAARCWAAHVQQPR